MPATLYLIPNLLSDSDINLSIPLYNLEIIKKIKDFIVEKPKAARRLLKKAGLITPFDDINFYELNKHTTEVQKAEIIDLLSKGKDLGIITESGYPVVADPGESIVHAAHLNNIRVIPLVGPSSILLAIAASGLNAENFTFHGYLPINKHLRIKRILELDRVALRTGYTQIFIETPYRTQSLFEDIIKYCKKETLLCLAIDITSDNENIKTSTVGNWRKAPLNIQKRLVVFLLGQIVEGQL